jgi:hypothetical protein
MAGETLKITGGNAAGQDINLEQELVIGRSTPGLGSLGGDTEISRVHARVFHDASGRLMVEDLGSTNGTFVNGNRISGQQALNPGDEVRVGQTTMSVEGGAAGATTVGNVVPAPVPAPVPPAPVPAEPTQALPPQQQGFGQAPPPPPYGGGPTGGPPQRAGGGPNRNLIIALAAALLVVLVVAGLAIGGVFSGSDSKSKNTAQTTPTTSTTPTVAMPSTPTETTPSQSPGGNGYSSTFKNSFVSSCAKSGSLSTSQCRCIINKAEAQYSLPDFISAVGQAQKGTTPPKLRQIFVSCANA